MAAVQEVLEIAELLVDQVPRRYSEKLLQTMDVNLTHDSSSHGSSLRAIQVDDLALETSLYPFGASDDKEEEVQKVRSYGL